MTVKYNSDINSSLMSTVLNHANSTPSKYVMHELLYERTPAEVLQSTATHDLSRQATPGMSSRGLEELQLAVDNTTSTRIRLYIRFD